MPSKVPPGIKDGLVTNVAITKTPSSARPTTRFPLARGGKSRKPSSRSPKVPGQFR